MIVFLLKSDSYRKFFDELASKFDSAEKKAWVSTPLSERTITQALHLDQLHHFNSMDPA